MYLSYAPRCHWLLSKVIKHVFQRAATTMHKLVVTDCLVMKIKLALVKSMQPLMHMLNL